MSGDTALPGGVDTAYGAYADYLAGKTNNINGSGNNLAEFMVRVETGILAIETYWSRVLGKVAGATISNNSSAVSTLASTINIPAGLLRAGSMLEVFSRGIVTLNSGSPTLSFTAKLGSTSFSLGTTTAFTANASAHQYIMRLWFTANTVGASGDIHVGGDWRVSAATSSGFDVNSVSLLGGATGTVDTTVDEAFDLTATMSVANAANTLISDLTTVRHVPFIG